MSTDNDRLKTVLFVADYVGLKAVDVILENNFIPEKIILCEENYGDINDEVERKIPSSRILYVGKDTTSLELELLDLNLDLIILAWWPYIIKESLINLSKQVINFHPSLLPHNRGKHGYFWSIVEERPYGVSIHLVDSGIDTGPVIFQREIPVSWVDTGPDLYEKCRVEIISLFRENFNNIITGNFKSIKQDSSISSFHKAKEIEGATKLDLDKEYYCSDLLNIIRGRNFKNGAAWFEFDGDKFEVRIDIKKIENED